MSFMVNQKIFTKALTVFCLLVFLYTVIPSEYNMVASILKYILIIFVIIILMMYSKILNIYHKNEIKFKAKIKIPIFPLMVFNLITKLLKNNSNF